MCSKSLVFGFFRPSKQLAWFFLYLFSKQAVTTKALLEERAYELHE